MGLRTAFSGHVEERLSELVEGRLGRYEEAKVRGHVDVCPGCAASLAAAERGLAALGDLGETTLPRTTAARIRAVLDSSPIGAARAPWRLASRWALAAGVAALLVAGALAAHGLLKSAPRVLESPSQAPMGVFERTALDLHTRAEAGTGSLDLASDSPAEVRRFVRERTRLAAPLATARPADEARRYRLRGAWAATVEGAAAAAVLYDVDGGTVLLLTARAAEIRDRPRAWTPFGKSVAHRVEGGRNVLTWANSGQVYSLVSRLPGRGLASCLVCHGDGPRRAQILSLAPSPSPAGRVAP